MRVEAAGVAAPNTAVHRMAAARNTVAVRNMAAARSMVVRSRLVDSAVAFRQVVALVELTTVPQPTAPTATKSPVHTVLHRLADLPVALADGRTPLPPEAKPCPKLELLAGSHSPAELLAKIRQDWPEEVLDEKLIFAQGINRTVAACWHWTKWRPAKSSAQLRINQP